jgi:hypothetical protein
VLLLKIALVMALLAPLITGVPLVLSCWQSPAPWAWVRWLDERLHVFGMATGIVWVLALVVGLVGWLR